MLRKEIGLRVKNIRLNMNMTKQKMADLLGISGQYLGMIERGEGTLSKSGEWQRRTAYKPPRVLIVLPPELDGDNTPYGDFFAGALAKTKAWGPVIEKAVRAAGAEYFDGGTVVGMPDQPDKVHLSAHEHELLGKAVAGKVREMMAR